MKKILNWFSYKPNDVFETFYFREMEDGRQFFLPYGCSDKGYEISPKQKKGINNLFALSLLVFVLSVLCFFYNVMPDTFQSLGTIAIALNIGFYAAIFFFYGLLFFYKKSFGELEDLPYQKNVSIMPVIASNVLTTVIFNNVLIPFTLLISNNPILWIFGVLVIIVSPILLLVLYKKTYIFQKDV